MSAVPNLPEDVPLVPTANGNGPNPHIVANGNSKPHPKLRDHPIDSARPLKVIVVGAGYSGIYLGIRIPERLRNVDLVIYEKVGLLH